MQIDSFLAQAIVTSNEEFKEVYFKYGNKINKIQCKQKLNKYGTSFTICFMSSCAIFDSRG